MYRIAFFLLLTMGLVACHNNEKATMASPSPLNGEKVYVGPSINTMDDANTFEMYSLVSEASAQGSKSYQLMVLLTYFKEWRYYDSATLENNPATTFKSVSREAGVCDDRGCIFKELMSIRLTDAFCATILKKVFRSAFHQKLALRVISSYPPNIFRATSKQSMGRASKTSKALVNE
jgi:hypothetical protein